MFVSNLQWNPIRLESRRIGNNRYEIFRDGESRGFVERHQGTWRSRIPRSGYAWGGDLRDHPSWRTAVLRLARYSMIWTSRDGPQDYGQVHMLRFNCGTVWFTVLLKGDRRFLYRDFTIPDRPEGTDQAMVWTVLRAADAYVRERGLRAVGGD